MTVQVGEYFETIWCFEPNGEALPILEANTRQLETPLTIYPYALGNENENLFLEVPDKNIGGAFLKVAENLYSDFDIAKKEGKASIHEVTLRQVPVVVRKASKALEELFTAIAAQVGPNVRGVIKVDVEGMEEFIVRSFVSALPSDMKIAVIFENWSDRIDLGKIGAGTDRGLKWGSVGLRHPFDGLRSKWQKLMFLLTHPFKSVRQATFYPPHSTLGTLVCWMD